MEGRRLFKQPHYFCCGTQPSKDKNGFSFFFFLFSLRKLGHISPLISYTCRRKSAQLLLHSQQFISKSDSRGRLWRLSPRGPSYLNGALQDPVFKCWLIFVRVTLITTWRLCFRLDPCFFTNISECICVDMIMWPLAVLASGALAGRALIWPNELEKPTHACGIVTFTTLARAQV